MRFAPLLDGQVRFAARDEVVTECVLHRYAMCLDVDSGRIRETKIDQAIANLLAALIGARFFGCASSDHDQRDECEAAHLAGFGA